uniref:Plexin domain containing 1 n=1 Tax=Poecilia latipinna TaxID=48699 RepID=A0A3B3TM36_9TELE
PEDRRIQDLWFDMTDVRHGQVRVHSILSNSYKQAVRVALSFDFPFYGHFLRQITIATGGFIFTGDVIHRMLTTTQYIAPLMANFDPSYSKDSTVQYLDNGEVFVVQWERVRLPGKESAGAFTFQAALYKTGRISFSYRDIPLTLDVIGSAEHPVKAGLSDAFMVMSSTSQSPDGAQQTIYEYHRVEIDMTKITNSSAVEITPLPSEQLNSSNKNVTLCFIQTSCFRCSDGMDRHRQEWLDYSCSEEVGLGRRCLYATDIIITTKSNMLVVFISYFPLNVAEQRRKSYWPSMKFQNQRPGYTEVEGEGHEKHSIVEAGPC